ncbi:hypothetical protein K490DRAFT_59074 [Saccharata proteae CBS 121410]|uniref:Uncharacterized protein n=1 Tax=Saccharata proteae CBS 121410 TaxID=1314787 RepID=A0A9P4HQR1_9PEZI|nr:hypothetical protein K490DRAFT_59074 [Saccharata proteae CBS 121410]
MLGKRLLYKNTNSSNSPMDSSTEEAAAHRAFGIVEIASEIFSYLLEMDLRLAREMWRNSSRIHFTYNAIFLSLLSPPSWTPTRNDALVIHTPLVPTSFAGFPRRRLETYYRINCTISSASELATLRAELAAVSPFWRSRQISRPGTTTLELCVLSENVHFEKVCKADGVTIGDFVRLVERGLDFVEEAGFPDRLRGVKRLQVVCMGPLMCILVLEEQRLYREYQSTMRAYVRWVPVTLGDRRNECIIVMFVGRVHSLKDVREWYEQGR